MKDWRWGYIPAAAIVVGKRECSRKLGMEEKRQPVGFCGDANHDIAFPHLHVMLHCLFSFFLILV